MKKYKVKFTETRTTIREVYAGSEEEAASIVWGIYELTIDDPDSTITSYTCDTDLEFLDNSNETNVK